LGIYYGQMENNTPNGLGKLVQNNEIDDKMFIGRWDSGKMVSGLSKKKEKFQRKVSSNILNKKKLSDCET